MFSALLSSVEVAHKAVVAEVEEKQQEAEKRVDRLVKELEKEIAELKSGQTTPEDLLDSKEYLRKVSYIISIISSHDFFFFFTVIYSKRRGPTQVSALLNLSAFMYIGYVDGYKIKYSHKQRSRGSSTLHN